LVLGNEAIEVRPTAAAIGVESERLPDAPSVYRHHKRFESADPRSVFTSLQRSAQSGTNPPELRMTPSLFEFAAGSALLVLPARPWHRPARGAKS
jgi:hypothetical protein